MRSSSSPEDARQALIVRECEQSLDRRLADIREEFLPKLIAEVTEKLDETNV